MLYCGAASSLWYFAMSRVTSCCKTSGVCSPASGATVDRSAKRFFTASLSADMRAAALSLATMSGGVPFGANKPFQPCDHAARSRCAVNPANSPRPSLWLMTAST